MSTFTSKFKGLPKSAQLRALAGAVIPAKESLPFSRLPEESFERAFCRLCHENAHPFAFAPFCAEFPNFYLL